MLSVLRPLAREVPEMMVTRDGHVIIENDDEGDVVEPVGAVIRRLRHDRSMSQRVLADALVNASGNDSVDREQVARWENGRRIPSWYWRRWLADVLGSSEEDLERAAAFARLERSLLQIARRN
jgi:transcriptional regulator with XRE-family HTH domain